MRTGRTMMILAGLAVVTGRPIEAQQRQRGFGVVLLVGDSKPTPAPDKLPPGASKALADVKDFLPYKGYRVLETQWLAGAKGGTTRLHGIDDQEYEAEIVADEVQAGSRAGALNVIFTLQDGGAASAADDELARSTTAGEAQLAGALERYNPNHPEVRRLESKLAEARRASTVLRARRLISSRFEMEIGETVVVGTSKLGGERALLVLLTAVASDGK